MNETITIKDVARVAEVSVGTVDRVIHERGHVSAEVRERVKQVMNDLGYQPNIMARSLANNKKMLRIAALLPDYSADPYWVQPKEGVEHAARMVRHYGVEVQFFYFPLFDPAGYLDTIEQVLAGNPNAVLFAPVFQAESEYLIRETTRLNIPKVMINTDIEGTDALCYIGQDSYQSGVLAGRLLNFGLNDGDQVLALSLDKSIANARHLLDKHRGFIDFFSQVKHKSVEAGYAGFENFDDPEAMRAWVAELLKKYPRLSGVFVTNSRAYKLIEVLDEEVIRQVKVVGYDLIQPNLHLLGENKIRFLINQNAWHQGYLGIMSFVKKLILKKDLPPRQYLPLDIVVKENVEYYIHRTLELPVEVV